MAVFITLSGNFNQSEIEKFFSYTPTTLTLDEERNQTISTARITLRQALDLSSKKEVIYIRMPHAVYPVAE